jgi:hypothetical protein
MSGHGQREARLKADAARWRDRVAVDIFSSVAGLAAMRHHKVAVDVLVKLANQIAGHIAAGEDLIEMRSGQARRVARFLEARGHVERVRGDLVRPIGARDGELL